MTRNTFIRRFPNGMAATLIVTMEEEHPVGVVCHWNKKLTAKRLKPIIGEYQTWRNDSLRLLCKKHNLKGGILVIE